MVKMRSFAIDVDIGMYTKITDNEKNLYVSTQDNASFSILYLNKTKDYTN